MSTAIFRTSHRSRTQRFPGERSSGTSSFVSLVLCLLCGAVVHADAPPNHYVLTADTVSDTKTGLVWQRAASSQMVWNLAGSYCQQLTLGGTGWRLPSAKELLTLVDPTRYDPAIDPNAFPGTKGVAYWSASTYSDLANSPASGGLVVFSVDFKTGALTGYPGNQNLTTRCVR
jgi:hypothetical protein